MKQSLGGGHGHQRGALRASARVPEDGDVIRIATELLDVVAHPGQCRYEVEHPGIARVGEVGAAEFGQVEVAEGVETMVHGDDDDVSAPAEACAVGVDFVARAARIRSAVEPDHDRPPPAIAERGRPDVEMEAVFADRPAAARGLRRDGAELERVTNAGPRGYWGGWQETPTACVGAVVDASEDVNAVVGAPAQLPRASRGNRGQSRALTPGLSPGLCPSRRRRRQTDIAGAFAYSCNWPGRKAEGKLPSAFCRPCPAEARIHLIERRRMPSAGCRLPA